jgi:polysaccharide pyruvyl transferase WcaK-like protein
MRTQPNYILLNDTSVTGHPGCVKVVEAIVGELAARGLHKAAACPVGVDPLRWPTTAMNFSKVDGVVVNAEGTLHHTASRPKARKLAAMAQVLKTKYDVPVFMVNATIEALERQDFENLRSFDHIYVRERKSQSYLESVGIESNVTADLTLTSFTNDQSVVRKGIFISDSVIPEVRAQLQSYADQHKLPFLQMRPSRRWAYPRYFFAPQKLVKHAEDFVSKVASAQGVITGRFHTMLFCIATNTPFLAVGSNSGKIASVMLDALGSTERQLPNLQAVVGAHVANFSNAELACLAAYRERAMVDSKSMFDHIADKTKARGQK